MQAVMHVMNLLEVDYQKPEVLLRGADPAKEVLRQNYGARSFLSATANVLLSSTIHTAADSLGSEKSSF